MPLQSKTTSSLFTIEVIVTVFEGEGLVAKDRNLFGKRTASDPYVDLVLRGTHVRKIGKTKTKQETLSPKWNETFQFVVQGDELLKGTNNGDSYAEIQLNVFDEDLLRSPDLLGVVAVPIHAKNVKGGPEWFIIPPESAKNASGRLKVEVATKVVKVPTLIRGNSLPIESNRVRVGLAWDMISNRVKVDLDSSCVAVRMDGTISMPDTVYYGNVYNPNMSIVHSGDEQEGDEVGDDETIRFQLDRVPSSVLAMYIVLTVATQERRLPDIHSTVVRVIDEENNDKVLCTFAPAQHALSRNSTAMFLLRIARAEVNSNAWVVSPIEDTHPTARDFGSLIPYIKGYTKDLLPSVEIDPTERVAIMRKGGATRLTDYCPHGTLPSTVVLGLAWDVTDGVNIDLDASAACLDANLNLIDKVWFRELNSSDGAIRHNGDEREGDEIGDDEKICIKLGEVNPVVQYIGFVINSFSGQELDDVHRASCHLFDPTTNLDMLSYALTNTRSLNGYRALVVGCLYRGENPCEWCFCIISEPAQGRTVEDNVDELQNYIRRCPPQVPAPLEEEIVLSPMPDAVPLNDIEIDLSRPL